MTFETLPDGRPSGEAMAEFSLGLCLKNTLTRSLTHTTHTNALSLSHNTHQRALSHTQNTLTLSLCVQVTFETLPDGRPSGEAMAEFANEVEAERAMKFDRSSMVRHETRNPSPSTLNPQLSTPAPQTQTQTPKPKP